MWLSCLSASLHPCFSIKQLSAVRFVLMNCHRSGHLLFLLHYFDNVLENSSSQVHLAEITRLAAIVFSSFTFPSEFGFFLAAPMTFGEIIFQGDVSLESFDRWAAI